MHRPQYDFVVIDGAARRLSADEGAPHAIADRKTGIGCGPASSSIEAPSSRRRHLHAHPHAMAARSTLRHATRCVAAW